MTTLRTLLGLVPIILSASAGVARALPPCDPSSGTPFGDTTSQDEAKLVAFAHAKGVDLQATLGLAYEGDADALREVFGLAMHFTDLDVPARAYGNMLHSMFLNIAEARGLQDFTSVLVHQDASTLQRVRDFLYYPAVCAASPSERAEAESTARREFPRLWPADYVFGKGDRLFE
jgi:hypothetical protein